MTSTPGSTARPPSEQLVDLHIYLVPKEVWNEKYKSAYVNVIHKTISAGFVRVLPELSLYYLRNKILDQLGYDVVPEEYVYLKSVGRCLTQVKSKQEFDLKVKNFLPPQVPLPELFILEAKRGVLNLGSFRESLPQEISYNNVPVPMNHKSPHDNAFKHGRMDLIGEEAISQEGDNTQPKWFGNKVIKTIGKVTSRKPHRQGLSVKRVGTGKKANSRQVSGKGSCSTNIGGRQPMNPAASKLANKSQPAQINRAVKGFTSAGTPNSPNIKLQVKSKLGATKTTNDDEAGSNTTMKTRQDLARINYTTSTQGGTKAASCTSPPFESFNLKQYRQSFRPTIPFQTINTSSTQGGVPLDYHHQQEVDQVVKSGWINTYTNNTNEDSGITNLTPDERRDLEFGLRDISERNHRDNQHQTSRPSVMTQEEFEAATSHQNYDKYQHLSKDEYQSSHMSGVMIQALKEGNISQELVEPVRQRETGEEFLREPKFKELVRRQWHDEEALPQEQKQQQQQEHQQLQGEYQWQQQQQQPREQQQEEDEEMEENIRKRQTDELQQSLQMSWEQSQRRELEQLSQSGSANESNQVQKENTRDSLSERRMQVGFKPGRRQDVSSTRERGGNSSFSPKVEQRINTTTSDSRRYESKQEELVPKLRQKQEMRFELEITREELMRQAKTLQSRTTDRRNKDEEDEDGLTSLAARDFWKKKYFEEKKKTTPLEDQVNKLRSQLDQQHRKLLNQLQGKGSHRKDEQQLPPSKKNDHKILIFKTQHDIDDLKRQVENSKMKLSSEIRLRNQAQAELRRLRTDVLQRKINLTVTRSRQQLNTKDPDDLTKCVTPKVRVGLRK